MNDNNLNQNNTNIYTASQNLNTEIDNPQINLNSATDVNVQNLGYDNQYQQPVDMSNNSFSNSFYDENNQINNNVVNQNSNVNSNLESSNSNISGVSYSVNNSTNVSYQPTMEEKKDVITNSGSSVLHSGEFKITLFILFILCLFLLVMPYVYDYIKFNMFK